MSTTAGNAEVEHPTRADVWKLRSAPGAFPADLLNGAHTAAAFFSAAFYGRNDVIYLADAGISEIVLIDLLEDKLDAMKSIYPEVTETRAGDAFLAAKQMYGSRRRFDVIVTDPFVRMSYDVLTNHFATFARVVEHTWVAGVTLGDLERAGIEPSVPGIQRWLDATWERRGFEAVSFGVRNPENGASWIGMRRRQKSWLGKLLRQP